MKILKGPGTPWLQDTAPGTEMGASSPVQKEEKQPEDAATGSSLGPC